MASRWDLDGEPVAVVWTPDAESYRQVGYIEIVPEKEGFNLSYLDDMAPNKLVAEDLPGNAVTEWESSAETDRGEGNWV